MPHLSGHWKIKKKNKTRSIRPRPEANRNIGIYVEACPCKGQIKSEIHFKKEKSIKDNVC